MQQRIFSALNLIYTICTPEVKFRSLFLGLAFIKCEKLVREAWNHLWVFTCAHREPGVFWSRTASVSPMAFKHCQNVNVLLLLVPTQSDGAGRWLAEWRMLTHSAGPLESDSVGPNPGWSIRSRENLFIWPFLLEIEKQSFELVSGNTDSKPCYQYSPVCFAILLWFYDRTLLLAIAFLTILHFLGTK